MSSPSRRVLVAGNWKMFHGPAQAAQVARALCDQLRLGPRTDVALAPTFVALHAVGAALAGTRVALAAQNCHEQDKGAFTGEVSPPMLAEAGCRYVIVGHSERRQYFAETDEGVNRKVRALQKHGLVPIACLGETLAERDAGRTFEVVSKQLEGMLAGLDEASVGSLVLAYEPVWAIGTGRTAKSSDAQAVHAFLRDRVRHKLADAAERVRILYGGSVKPDNAAELLAQPDIDGALVGGASLEAGDFARIIQAAG